MATTIDKAGRLVIPKEIRELAGLKPGVKLNVDYRYGLVVIEPITKIKLFRKGSLLVSRAVGAPKMSLELSNRLIRRHRDGLF